jgi:hypothetical protein
LSEGIVEHPENFFMRIDPLKNEGGTFEQYCTSEKFKDLKKKSKRQLIVLETV